MPSKCMLTRCVCGRRSATGSPSQDGLRPGGPSASLDRSDAQTPTCKNVSMIWVCMTQAQRKTSPNLSCLRAALLHSLCNNAAHCAQHYCDEPLLNDRSVSLTAKPLAETTDKHVRTGLQRPAHCVSVLCSVAP